ncbi:MAG: methyltransferase domain-containing protein [Candidatus Diapherotrites archaeon]|uniref:Methyltransferase domain-containing protein n=1 Tax=Candidatus Iainarchaeum sp. TaxID=3101447 RepID=A0A938YW93_9ARCH|nr:methyltransferase domain-containing protein [Candidatus Diapherotrites archaeon]
MIGITKLNLGCGHEYLQGYVNIDLNRKVKADKYLDVTKRMPFATNSVEEIRAHHLIEDFGELEPVLREWYRILKPGGLLRVWVPYAFSNHAFVNPGHKHYFVWNTLLYFTDRIRPNYFYSFQFKLKKREFQMLGRYKGILGPLAGLATAVPEFYERFLKGFFSVDVIYYELEKPKGKREGK